MEWLVEAQRRAEQPHCFETRSPSGYRFNLGPGPSSDIPIRWEIPELGEVVTERTNGTPMPIARTKPSPGLELAMRAEGPASLSYTVLRNGAVDRQWPTDVSRQRYGLGGSHLGGGSPRLSLRPRVCAGVMCQLRRKPDRASKSVNQLIAPEDERAFF